MVFGRSFNIFFKDSTELLNEEKLNKLSQYSTGDMLTLLRNIEESPREYDEEIIKGLYNCLHAKGIVCI